MLRAFLTLAFLFMAAAAEALSCLPHDIAATYREAADSAERYIVVVGEMTFDESLLPETNHKNQAETPPDTHIPARLKGLALSRAGFNLPYEKAITFNAQCIGPWCSGASSGGHYLAFVNLDRAPPEVSASPCGGFLFFNPTREMEDRVIQCRNGGTCKPDYDR